jgi:pimeloyl-ACP methyl ester carboxylesterase
MDPALHAAIEARLARVPVQTVAVGAGRVQAYRTLGAGTPLVLLHGIGSNSGSWVPAMERLAATHRVIAWDAPGYGRSTPLSPARPVAADYARVAMLDALAIDRAVIAGHSLGALVAGSFAADHADRVIALALLDPAGGYGRADPAVRDDRLASRLKLMAELGPAGMAEKRAGQLLGSRASAEALAMVQSSMRALDPHGHEQAAHMLATGALVDDVARYPHPVLVLCGTEDRITPEDGCRAIAAACPRSDYRSLAGLGHACYVEAPDVVAEHLRQLGSSPQP